MFGHARIKRGKGHGVRTPLENHKNKGVLAIPGPDHLEITKLPSQHSKSGNQRPASETPFKWCFACGPTMARFLVLNANMVPLSSPHQLKKVRVGPPPTKVFASAHVGCCVKSLSRVSE